MITKFNLPRVLWLYSLLLRVLTSLLISQVPTIHHSLMYFLVSFSSVILWSIVKHLSLSGSIMITWPIRFFSLLYTFALTEECGWGKSPQSDWLVSLHHNCEPGPESGPTYSAFSPHTTDEQSLLRDKAISNLCIRPAPFSPTQQLCFNHCSLFLWNHLCLLSFIWIEIPLILKKKKSQAPLIPLISVSIPM